MMAKKKALALLCLMFVALSVIPVQAALYQFACPPECGVIKYWFCDAWEFFVCDVVLCQTFPPGGDDLEPTWGNCR